MKSILVGTDFSNGSLIALDIAVDMCRRTGLNLKIVWVKKNKILASSEQLETTTHLAEDKLKSLCEKYQPQLTKSTIEWMILEGRVAEQIAELARKLESPMIVIGTNGASGFEKYVMGSTAVRIVMESPCPVLTIREGYDHTHGVHNIVVPIRTTPNSRQKVPHAIAAAKRTGAKIHNLGLLDTEQDRTALATYLKQVEEKLAKEGVEYVTTMVKYEDYADCVLNYADKVEAEMLVISTEQNRKISSFFLGTNAQQIVHRSQIPVLCIHPEDLGTISR